MSNPFPSLFELACTAAGGRPLDCFVLNYAQAVAIGIVIVACVRNSLRGPRK